MKEKNSALKVLDGIEQPNQVNKEFLKKYNKKKNLSIEDYVQGILNKDRTILSKAIT